MDSYAEFLARKTERAATYGFEPGTLSAALYPFQERIVRWALRRGRAAIFAECGMGKTPMQLEWARHVAAHTGSKVLILAPLAVSQQTVREGAKFGIEVTYARSQSEAQAITIANYEMLEHFTPSEFAGVVLDESSILKAYSGIRKRQILAAFRDTPYRLACTATPAPNDHMELGNHSEFLGVMSSHRMLSRWFLNDTTQAGVWRLKRHGAADFWRWVASWAVALELPSDLGFADDGFVLPGMDWQTHTVDVDVTEGRGEVHGQAALFRDPSLSATTMHAEMRRTAAARCAKVAALVASQPREPWIVWCNTNYEADELVRLMPDAVEVRGAESIDAKERKIAAFGDGTARVIITKPSICGFGLNWQHCARMAFVGLSYSYEALYQAMRRSYRFGQTRNVEAHVVCAATEGAVLATILRKQSQHSDMKAALRSAVREVQMAGTDKQASTPDSRTATGVGWTLALGDVVTRIPELASDSVGLSVFSPPFSSLYTYSDSLHDMGNCADDATFMEHFGFLVRELLRVTMPGRLACVHVKNLVDYMGSESEGRSGIRDFRGAVIRLFQECGWKWHSEVCIWKCPVTEMQRTKSHGLLYKQLRADSTYSRQGIAEYLLAFRAWKGEDAAPVTHTEDTFPLDMWQRYASPVWMDIDQTDVLNARGARADEDEKHICPLQLGVIRRCVELWSNPGDLVLDPFMGIGSTGVVALQMGRRAQGFELKPEYYEQARKNLAGAVRQGDLFAAMETGT